MVTVRELDIPGVLEITPSRIEDARGHFSEVFSAREFNRIGLDAEFVQDNQSLSRRAGTVRGLHFQVPPHAQAKLVRVVRGAIFDVAVDIRSGSPTFGRWAGCELSAAKGNQLFVPEGFAHGFMTLEPDTEVLYKVSAFYSRDSELALRWNDPHIAIDWPATGEVTLSEKDADAPLLRDFASAF